MTMPNTTDAMYRMLVHGVAEYAITMLALDGTVCSWNPGAEQVMGYTAEEIVGHPVSRFDPTDESSDTSSQHVLGVAREEGRWEGDVQRVRKEGSVFWARVTIDLVRNEMGEAVGFAMVTRDLTSERAEKRRIRTQENNFRLLVQGVSDYAIYMLNTDGTVSNWNVGAERAKGYVAAEIVGRHFSQFYTPEDRQKGLPQRALATALANGKFEGQGWRVRKTGERFWAHVLIHPIYNEDGEQIGFAKITRDLTESKKQMDEIRKIKENLDLALSNMSQGLCLFDQQERLILCNERFREILGLQHSSIAPGSTYVDLMWALHSSTTSDPQVVSQRVQATRDEHLRRLRGCENALVLEESWNDRTVMMSHRRVPEGGWVTTLEDVTEKKRIEKTIVHLAHHDSLTELPNRASFRERAEACLRMETPCALLYMDLDRFKPINDTLGHPTGDKVLQAVAERINAQLRKQDLGARLGGDEFAILLVGCETAQDAAGVADRLIRDVCRPILIGDVEVNVGLSVGIAFRTKDTMDADILLRNADLALYAAKQAGRGCHREFEAGMERHLETRRDLERDLRAALSRGEFFLHYQPVINIKDKQVTSFEALLRWKSPTRGIVAPIDFIPFAEEVGLMPDIGDWVLQTACRDAVGWDSNICISVNLSPTQFAVADLVGRIEAALKDSGLAPQRLELEITETAMIQDLQHARTILAEIRALNVQIAMDDFGTGYSSLSFLRNLPFTRIKIDRSFIQDLGKNREALAIIRAVTSMCDGMGVAATAEGVETEEQMNILLREGCGEAQGYLIRKPSGADEAQAWLSSYSSEYEDCPQMVLMSA